MIYSENKRMRRMKSTAQRTICTGCKGTKKETAGKLLQVPWFSNSGKISKYYLQNGIYRYFRQ